MLGHGTFARRRSRRRRYSGGCLIWLVLCGALGMMLAFAGEGGEDPIQKTDGHPVKEGETLFHHLFDVAMENLALAISSGLIATIVGGWFTYLGIKALRGKGKDK